MGHSAPDNRADNAQHDCPRDRQMRMQKGFCHATRQETDDDIPDKMKHVFLVTFCDFEINRSDSKSAVGSHAEEMTNVQMSNSEEGANHK